MVTEKEQALLDALAGYVDERIAIYTEDRPTDERDALVLRTYKPDKTTTGIPLSEWQYMSDWNPSDTQQVYINEPLVLDHKFIHGQIKFGPNGSLRGRYMALDGPANPNDSNLFTGETAILDCDKPPGSLGELKDSIIFMKVPHPKFNGFKGAGISFIRVQIAWVTDCWGPYTKQGQSWDTNVKIMGCLGSHTVYWPGQYFADRNPKYWDGTGWNPESSKTIKRNLNGIFWDPVHKDGTHNDICEIHSARGSHIWVTDHYEGTGILIDGSVLYSIDAYGEGNPFAVPITVPYLGNGDNPKRGLKDGGQKDTHQLPYTEWSKPMKNGKYAANGVGLYIGQVTGELFSTDTAVATCYNWISGGNMGMQEQDKGLEKIAFLHHNNIYGPDWYMWASDNTRDTYPVRINDYLVQDQMPDFSRPPVIIPNGPDGSPPFGPGGNNVWELDGTPVGLGSSTVDGVRVR